VRTAELAAARRGIKCDAGSYLERELAATPTEQGQDVQSGDENCKRRCKLEAHHRDLHS
jgi:hypothetical protein